jgi:hypothetical protein
METVKVHWRYQAMLAGALINVGRAAGFQPAKPQPAKPRRFRELLLNVDLSAKIKFNILTTLSAAEVQDGLRNGTVVPDWKKQILTTAGEQIGTFTIAEAAVKDVQ